MASRTQLRNAPHGRRRQFNKRKRRPPFYRRAWFWTIIGVILCLSLFSALTAFRQAGNTQSASQPAVSSSLLSLSQGNYLTNRKGTAVIKGRSLAGAVIYVNDQRRLTVSAKGSFQFKYRLKTMASATLTVKAQSITGATASKSIHVTPSRSFQADGLKQQQSRTSGGTTASSGAASASEPFGTSQSSAAKSQKSAQSASGQSNDTKQSDSQNAYILNASKSLDFTLSDTTIGTVKTMISGKKLVVTLNWKNDSNSDNPMFATVFSVPKLTQKGQALTHVDSTDDTVNLLPRLHNTVGASIAIQYLYELKDGSSPVTIVVSGTNGASRTLTVP